MDSPLNQLSQAQSSPSQTTKILFVCYANICRSPMAEAIMRDLVEEAGLSSSIIVDSAGTEAHIGRSAYEGTLNVLRTNGVASIPTVSRQLEYEDLNTFDYVLAMDRRNLAFILQHSRGTRTDIRLFLNFANVIGLVNGEEVIDPFPDGDYDLTYRVIQAGCRALLQHIQEKQGL